MTMMMQKVADGSVTIEFNVAGKDEKGKDVMEKKQLKFFYELYKTEFGGFRAKFTKVEPNDPALSAKFLADKAANDLLRKRIAAEATAKFGDGKTIIIEEATGL